MAFDNVAVRDLQPGDVVFAFQNWNQPQTLAAICINQPVGDGRHNLVVLIQGKIETYTYDGNTIFAKHVMDAPVMYTTNQQELLTWLEAPA